MRFIAAAALALLLGAAGCGPQPSQQPKFQLTDVTGANFGKTLTLTDHTGKPRTLADFQGKVVVVFFGFTQCPDVCPTTLGEMAKVVKELGADGGKVQVLFVSVDPERDTRELLKQYVTAFHPSFLGLSGDVEATKVAAKEFKVYVQKQPAAKSDKGDKGDKSGSYSVDHSAGTFILDQQGRLRLFAQYGAGAPALLNDIKTLLKQAS
jgi:protein SCO1/2